MNMEGKAHWFVQHDYFAQKALLFVVWSSVPLASLPKMTVEGMANWSPLPAHYHNQEFQRITNDNLSSVEIVTIVFTVNCIDFLSLPKRL